MHRDRVVHVRVTAAEAAAIVAVAGPGGVSGWLRRLIHEALSRPVMQPTITINAPVDAA